MAEMVQVSKVDKKVKPSLLEKAVQGLSIAGSAVGLATGIGDLKKMALNKKKSVATPFVSQSATKIGKFGL